MNRLFWILTVSSMIFAACSTGRPAAKEKRIEPGRVLNKTWQWVSTVTPSEKITAPAPENYTIHLAGEGRLKAMFDCNTGGGTYQIAAGKISFGPLMSTRMACPEGSLDFVFMQDLQRVQSFYVQAGELYLVLPMDSGTMRFRSTP